MNRTPRVGTDERVPLPQFPAETNGSVGLYMVRQPQLSLVLTCRLVVGTAIRATRSRFSRSRFHFQGSPMEQLDEPDDSSTMAQSLGERGQGGYSKGILWRPAVLSIEFYSRYKMFVIVLVVVLLFSVLLSLPLLSLLALSFLLL